jgi:signal peptidase I
VSQRDDPGPPADDSASLPTVSVADDNGATAPGATAPAKVARRRRRGRVLAEWAVIAACGILLAVGVRAYALQAFFVPSGSMIPTLQIGDRILVDKFLFNYHDLTRGDIVVFDRPPADTFCGADEADLVKRVIGLPGQTIWSKGNAVFIDGKRIDESYLPANDPLGTKPIARQKIPPNDYFVMGDNRSISCDSRYWGPVPGRLIVGRVVLIWWRAGHPYFHLL